MFAKTGVFMSDGSPQIKLTKDVYSKASTKDLLGPSGQNYLTWDDITLVQCFLAWLSLVRNILMFSTWYSRSEGDHDKNF